MTRNFNVVYSPDDKCYLVNDAENRATSCAVVPYYDGFAFKNADDAKKQARKLSGTDVEVLMIETPTRFERAFAHLPDPF